MKIYINVSLIFSLFPFYCNTAFNSTHRADDNDNDNKKKREKIMKKSQILTSLLKFPFILSREKN